MFRFAFLVMSADHAPEVNRMQMQTDGCKTVVIGVRDLDQACLVAKELVDAGEVDRIELCGAFHEEGAWTVADALGDPSKVGYIAELPEV